MSSFPEKINVVPVTIANGAALSSAINLDGTKLVAIQMPGSWTTANLTFQGSNDGTTFNDVYDSAGNEVSVTAAASRYILLASASFEGLKVIKVRSGTTGTPVNQGADRTVYLVTVAR